MATMTLDQLASRLDLADQLLAGRHTMFEPQDLPGRYGRVIRAVDRLLEAMQCEAVVGGGWAVWRHGFLGRVTQDVDVVLPADRVDEFLRAASVSGFSVVEQPPGRWPKVLHKETDVRVDILPAGARPGTPKRLAPTTIAHPAAMGAVAGRLTYVSLPALVELKLAAGRAQDDADVIKLVQENRDRRAEVRAHLATVHADYAARFDELVIRADEEAQ